MIWLFFKHKEMSKEDTKLFFCIWKIKSEKMNLLVLVDHEEVFLDHEGDIYVCAEGKRGLSLH